MQCVSYNNTTSDYLTVDTGVPQGSILGSLLFLIYINDIVNASTLLRILLFADDTTLLYSNKSYSDLFRITNIELSKLNTWFQVNKLSLNIDKTKYMIFEPKKILNRKYCKLVMQDYNQLNIYIHDTQLERVNNTKFLGVTVDSELNWKQHITSVENKLSSIIGILYRIRFKITKKAALLIYDALIYSHLSYCNLLWASTYKSSLDKLFILQKRALKNCLNLPKRTETNIVFELADKLSVYQINKLQTASFIF